MKTVVFFGCVLSVLFAEGKVFRAKEGHSFAMECGVNSYRKSLKWDREGTLVHRGLSGIPVKGSSSGMSGRSQLKNTKLEINQVMANDAGQFTCTADGTTNVHRLIVVSVSVQPSADLLVGDSAQLVCQVHGPGSYSVQWKRPSGDHVQLQTVELKPVQPADAGTWECIFTIEGAPQNEPLAIRVTKPAPSTAAPLQPKIPQDDTNPSCPTCAPVRPTPKLTKTWLELPWWVWVAVGVGGLVVILLIIAIIVVCKRIRRRKRRVLQMKNGKPMKPKQYCQCQHQRPTAAAKKQQGRRREKPSALPLQPLLTE